jgi:hypothetical protein
MNLTLNEKLRFQKQAGIINESQYKKLLKENEEMTPEKAAEITKELTDNLIKNPDLLKKALSKAQEAGISMGTIKQAVGQVKQGKDAEAVLTSVSNNLNEDTVSMHKIKGALSYMGIGTVLGGSGALLTAAGMVGAAALGPAIIAVALAGAIVGLGLSMSKSSGVGSGGESNGVRIDDYEMLYKAGWAFKNDMLDQGRDKNTMPDRDLFFIVDNGAIPKELKGKTIWRHTIGNRDIVGDRDALYKS